MASLNHTGLYVKDLDRAKLFFEKYFGAKAGAKYQNPKKGFASYLLEFDNTTKLEIMSKTDILDAANKINRYGYAHISISVGNMDMVDHITRQLVLDGFKHIDGPRTTGDGYYESAILDAEGNVIEITV